MKRASTFGRCGKDECAALWGLQTISGIGDKRAHSLVDEFGSPLDVLSASAKELTEFHYITDNNVSELRSIREDLSQYQDNFQECEESQVWVRTILDDDYPDRLKNYHAPLFIFGQGNAELLHKKSVSFSGSREADKAAKNWVADIAAELADQYVIISGGAKGIDKSAHQGTLSVDGQTIVVSATGHNNPYPSEHTKLFNQVIQHNGAVISHRPPNATANRHAFLHRNETNSALSQGIVIGAADTESGSLSQYRDAKAQDKTVFVPEPGIEPSPIRGLGEIVSDSYPDVHQISSATELVDILTDTEVSSSNATGSDVQKSIDEFR